MTDGRPQQLALLGMKTGNAGVGNVASQEFYMFCAVVVNVLRRFVETAIFPGAMTKKYCGAVRRFEETTDPRKDCAEESRDAGWENSLRRGSGLVHADLRVELRLPRGARSLQRPAASPNLAYEIRTSDV